MSTILSLAPQNVWKHFYSLTQIPRPSGHMEKVTEFLINFGKGLGLESFVDEVGNVIIRKPATPGMENRKGVILQAHMDMVPQKNNDTVHDFEKDPIETYIDGDWVKAKGTTLGADNGLGVAAIMAVLEANDLKHGPLEALITKDEETGMYGAFGLKPGTVNGEILLNLDSEDEGELYIGCAGGMDVTATLEYKEVAPEEAHYPDTAQAHSLSICKMIENAQYHYYPLYYSKNDPSRKNEIPDQNDVRNLIHPHVVHVV